VLGGVGLAWENNIQLDGRRAIGIAAAAASAGDLGFS